MISPKAQTVILGAGIVGVTIAYHLAVNYGYHNIILIDEQEPLTLTSNKGTGAYRNWWPGPDNTMVQFINRSIDLLENIATQSNNIFELDRRGYVFMTATQSEILNLQAIAQEICSLGAGQLRIHTSPGTYQPNATNSLEGIAEGADLLLVPDEIRRYFPHVTQDVVGLLHVRRCGCLNLVDLGKWLLSQALAHGVVLKRDCLESAIVTNNRLETIKLTSGLQLAPERLILAVGPRLKSVGQLLGLDLPVSCELHGKIALTDSYQVVPSDSPLIIWNDPVDLPWTEAERQHLFATNRGWLTETLPAGVHMRVKKAPTDNAPQTLLIIWTYEHKQFIEPPFPPHFDPDYGEVLIRGLARMIPSMSQYFGQGAQAYLDGGYYCKTPENRPLIGPLPIEKVLIAGALSGFGVMASQATADLIANYLQSEPLPSYAAKFHPNRYNDDSYKELLRHLNATSGQL